MLARGFFQAWFLQSVYAFNLKQPAHARGDCAVDHRRLTNELVVLNTVKDKIVFVNVCSSPVTAACDTGASVFYLSQKP